MSESSPAQRVWLGVWQSTDGTKPAAEATFDNVILDTYEVPRVAIQQAVRLTWPSTGMNYSVEAAPTLQGRWRPLNTALPGIQQETAPASNNAEFFRLIPAP